MYFIEGGTVAKMLKVFSLTGSLFSRVIFGGVFAIKVIDKNAIKTFQWASLFGSDSDNGGK